MAQDADAKRRDAELLLDKYRDAHERYLEEVNSAGDEFLHVLLNEMRAARENVLKALCERKVALDLLEVVVRDTLFDGERLLLQLDQDDRARLKLLEACGRCTVEYRDNGARVTFPAKEGAA